METKLSNWKALQGANNTWKQERGIFGLINYVSRNFRTDTNLRQVFSEIPGFKTCKSSQDVKNLLTVDVVKAYLGQKQFKTTKQDGKQVRTSEPKMFFSLFTLGSAVLAHHKVSNELPVQTDLAIAV